MSDEFGMVALETVTNQYLGGDASLACSAETQTEDRPMVVELVKRSTRRPCRSCRTTAQSWMSWPSTCYEKETITGEEFMDILNREDESAAPAEEKTKE